MSLPDLKEISQKAPQDSSGGKFYHFAQQYLCDWNSVVWNSTTKFLVHEIFKIPTTTIQKVDLTYFFNVWSLLLQHFRQVPRGRIYHRL